jgi:hypothetical protein
MRWSHVVALLACYATVIACSRAGEQGSSSAGGKGGAASGATSGVRISGNRILKDDKPIQLRGVNRSGTEYACIQGHGFFDGPADEASIAAIVAWRANAVRVPMNEDCWLAINGAPAQYSGALYQQAIAEYVNLLEQHGIIPILELHWTAAGSGQATGQQPMPDRDHAPTFWAEVAAAFKNDAYVVFEPFNEPYPDDNQDTDAAWACWRDGGSCPGFGYQAAGMQELVTAIRGAGARNPILLGGVQYANSLSRWLEHAPHDPEDQLGAAAHVYNFNTCNDTGCLDQSAAPLAQRVPVVATEIGEDDCGGGFVAGLMPWFDSHGVSYLGWTWDTWGECLALIKDYDGSPNGAYGQAYRDHLLSFP